MLGFKGIESEIHKIYLRNLSINEITDPEIGFNLLGGDSILMIGVLSDIVENYNVIPDLTKKYSPSVKEMAELVYLALSDSAEGKSVNKELESKNLDDITVPFVCNRYLFSQFGERKMIENTISTPPLKVASDIGIDLLKVAFKNILIAEDSLRLSVMCNIEGKVQQHFLPETHNGFVDLFVVESVLSDEQKVDYFEQLIREAEWSFDFGTELSRLIIFEDRISNELYISVVVNHLCADALGFHYLMSKFSEEVIQLQLSTSSVFSGPRISYKDFVSCQLEFYKKNLTKSLEYWKTLPWKELDMLPKGSFDSLNKECYTEFVKHPLLEGDYDNHVDLPIVLIFSIARAYKQWSGRNILLIDMVFHGREITQSAQDFSSIVAWTSETRPLLVDSNLNDRELLIEIERQLAHLSTIGGTWGYAKFISDDPICEEIKSLPQADISLNLLPSTLPKRDYKNVFTPINTRPSYEHRKIDSPRIYSISGGCYIDKSKLMLSWDFSSKVFEPHQIERFAKICSKEFYSIKQKLPSFAMT